MRANTSNDTVSDTNVDVAKSTTTYFHICFLIERVDHTCVDDDIANLVLGLELTSSAEN